MGLFDGIDFDNVEEFTGGEGLQPGTYPVVIAAVDTDTDKDGISQLVITYTVTEGDSEGRQKKEWLKIIPGSPTEDSDKSGFYAQRTLKTRLISFGIPASKFNSLEPDDLLDIEGALTLKRNKKNPEYVNVSYFALPSRNAPKADMPSKPAASSSDNPFEED